MQRQGSNAVVFDLSQAKVIVADVNASGTGDLADTAAGDRVIVQAKLAKNADVVPSLGARKLIDLTKPPAS